MLYSNIAGNSISQSKFGAASFANVHFNYGSYSGNPICITHVTELPYLLGQVDRTDPYRIPWLY
jgi:hypothetical protein